MLAVELALQTDRYFFPNYATGFVLYPFSAPPAHHSSSFDQESGRSYSDLPGELTRLLTQQQETTQT